MKGSRHELPLLDLMEEDMEGAPALYRPTRFWQRCCAEISGDLRSLGPDGFRSHPSALRYYVPAYRSRARKLRLLLRLLSRLPRTGTLREILHRHLEGTDAVDRDYTVFSLAESSVREQPPRLAELSDSGLCQPPETILLDGRRYSASFLRYLRGLAFLKRSADTRRVRSVLEIGGGLGTLGEVLLGCPDRRFFYVDVDIPPLAYVATYYLSRVFGPENVASYETTRSLEVLDLAELRRKYRAAVLCSWQLPRLRGDFDLFVNFVSFQEMEPEVVENYAGHVQRLVRSYLLLRNSVAGKQGTEEPVQRELYARVFDRFDLLASDARFFGESSPGFRSEVTVFSRRPDRA